MSEVKETMEDFASELEASYKEYDARRNNAYQDQEGPDAEKWAELAQQMEDKTVLKVKVKEAAFPSNRRSVCRKIRKEQTAEIPWAIKVA